MNQDIEGLIAACAEAGFAVARAERPAARLRKQRRAIAGERLPGRLEALCAEYEADTERQQAAWFLAASNLYAAAPTAYYSHLQLVRQQIRSRVEFEEQAAYRLVRAAWR